MSLRRPTLATFSLVLLLSACKGGFIPRDASPDGDGDGPCLGVACSAHGVCIEVQGRASCACDPGFVPSGVECLPRATDGDGDVDGDGDGDADPPPDADEEACDDSDGDGVCDEDDRCPGLDDGLSAQVEDPDFDNPLAWVRSGNADVIAGEGVFHRERCSDEESGALRQDLCMTAPDEGWYVIRGLVSWDCASCLGLGLFQQPDFVVSIDDDVHSVDSFELFDVFGQGQEVDLTLCPGERALGGVVQLEIESALISFPCDLELAFGRLSIERSTGQCPAPGEVLNGGFDPEGGAWSPMDHIRDDGTGNFVASLFDPAGAASGRSSIRGRIGVPLSTTLPSPAVQLRARGRLAEDGRFVVRLRSEGDSLVLWDTAVLLETWATVRFCLPRTWQGLSAVLSFEFNNNNVDRTVDLEAEVDEVTIVSDPATCP